MTSGWRHFSLDRRPAMIIAGILLAGLIGLDLWYFLFGHELVRRMYFGESLPVLNRIIEGQNSTPLEEYWEIADVSLAFANAGLLVSWGLVLTFRRMGLRVCLGAMSLLGVLLAVVSTSRYGAAVFPDTANYVSAARSLAEGEGYMNFNGTVYASWPPLLPTLLALFPLFEMDLLSAMRFSNAIVFGLLIFASSTYYRNNMRSERLILVATGATLVAMPLLTVAVAATADLLFALMVVLSMLSWQRLSSTGRVGDLILFSAIVSLACLTRYAGLPLIPGGLLLILLFVPRRLVARLVFAFGFVVVAAIPLVLWMVRTYHLTATVSGGRCSAENMEILRGVYYALHVLSTWFMPYEVWFSFRISIVGLVGVAAVTTLWLRRNDTMHPKSNRLRELAPPFIMSVLYICFLVLYTSTEPDYYNINNRLLAPIYPLIVCLVFAGLEGCLSIAENRTTDYTDSTDVNGAKLRWRELPLGKVLVGIGLVLWLGYSFISLEGKVASCLLTGTGEFSTVTWRKSALMKWMKDHPLDGDLYSNAADAMYLLADRKAMFMPHQSRGVMEMKDAKEFKANLSRQKSTYFVWFQAMNTKSLHSVESLSLVVPLESYRTFSDGAIYRYAGNHSHE